MLAIIGGSGFYRLFDKAKELKIDTPYGPPSDKLTLGKIENKQIVFLPRHNKTHDLPPHKINYQANIWALDTLKVKRIISFTAAGSLQKKINRGDFVILDQFVDRTKQRFDTFFDGPNTTHISTAYPYCPQLAKIILSAAKNLNIKIHKKGTVVVINGPRFSTYAESLWYSKENWDVINMTQYPEVVLAREKKMCYSAIALVTDYDVGIAKKEKIPPVTSKEIVSVLKKNNQKALKLIHQVIKKIFTKKDLLSRTCSCQKILDQAKI